MNDILIFLVLVGVALIFRWLSRQATDDSEKAPPDLPNEPIARPPPQTEEERVRRFLEALGQPPGTPLPPRVQPRRRVEPRVSTPVPRPEKVKRSWAQPLPPLTTIPPPQPVVVEIASPPPVFAPVTPVPAAPPVVRPSRLMPARPALPRSLGEKLHSPRSLREIVVLREVLGPPRGLQALDDLRSF